MPKRKAKSSSRSRFKWLAKWLFVACGVGGVFLLGYCVYLNHIVTQQFEGKRFSLPARVFARPLEIFPGAALSPVVLQSELKLLRYSGVNQVAHPGEFAMRGNTIEVFGRPFNFWDGEQAAMHMRIHFAKNHIDTIERMDTNTAVDFVRFDPLVIGGIYPGAGEDRELIRLEQVPRDVVNALIAIEDKRFFEHHGVDPKALLRAVSSLFFSERIQGGSTITQQLVKNFFLTQERTLRRKFTEMLMAFMLEYHYTKPDILETYINEVFLGQDGDRAIHGFGLASQFYFAKSLEHVSLQEAAMLVGLLKGPTYYNPRVHPERARARRDLVLQEMYHQELITQQQLLLAKSSGLSISAKPTIGQSYYPAFQELVVRQLKQDYREQDLRSEGLRIFTTVDPHVQNIAETAMQQRLQQIEKDFQLTKDSLEGAVIIADVASGEVTAIVGGRQREFKGFNRALDASRQIGSLIKPAMYLTAFTKGYSLTSMLDDSAFTWSEAGIQDWQPKNYDEQFHGEVPLWQAFAHSYNVAAARLGTELGVNHVMDTVQRLGIQKTLPTFASGLLGTVHLTPFEVAQMYHTLATGGFKMPFRSIREVTTKNGQPLNRYNVRVELVVDEVANYLTLVGMQQVVQHGTGQGLQRYLPQDLHIAGKTGTTDELRDSWFAGFSGDRLAVVWVGNDLNKSVRLTGATGALTIWGQVMQQLPLKPLILPVPDGVKLLPVDPHSGVIDNQHCNSDFLLPFVVNQLGDEDLNCLKGSRGTVQRWIDRIFRGKNTTED